MMVMDDAAADDDDDDDEPPRMERICSSARSSRQSLQDCGNIM